MRRSDRHPCSHHRLAAVLLLAHLLAVIALASSPRLHHWVHPDEDDDDHDCAAVLFLHGGCGQMPAPAAAPAGVHIWLTAAPPALPLARVAAVFLVNGTLEHAPPRAVRA